MTLDGEDCKKESSMGTASLVTRPEEKWGKLPTGTPCRNMYTKTGTERLVIHFSSQKCRFKAFLNKVWFMVSFRLGCSNKDELYLRLILSSDLKEKNE